MLIKLENDCCPVCEIFATLPCNDGFCVYKFHRNTVSFIFDGCHTFTENIRKILLYDILLLEVFVR